MQFYEENIHIKTKAIIKRYEFYTLSMLQFYVVSSLNTLGITLIY